MINSEQVIQRVTASAVPVTIEVDRFFEADDIVVFERDSQNNVYLLTQGVHYTVTGAGNKNGGEVVVNTREGNSGDSIFTVFNDIADQQDKEYVPSDTFPAQTHEAVVDRRTLVSRKLTEIIRRCIRFPVWGTINNAELGDPLLNVGKVIGINSSGNVDYLEHGHQLGWLVFPNLDLSSSGDIEAGADVLPEKTLILDTWVDNQSLGTGGVAQDLAQKKIHVVNNNATLNFYRSTGGAAETSLGSSVAPANPGSVTLALLTAGMP